MFTNIILGSDAWTQVGRVISVKNPAYSVAFAVAMAVAFGVA
jgi:hypothetical protein